MRFIPTSVHGLGDYGLGLVLLAGPWLLGFGGNNPQTWVPTILGIGATAYSLCTCYEWGAIPMISMGMHLALDFGSGLLLAASPWLFGFADFIWAPHLILGLMEMGIALTTQTVPGHVGALPARRVARRI